MNIYIYTHKYTVLYYICMPERQTWQWWQISIFKKEFHLQFVVFVHCHVSFGVYFQSFEMIRNDMTWYEMIVELMKVEGRTYPLLSALCLPLSCRVTDKHGSQTTTELVNHMTWFKSKIPNRRLIDKIQPRDCKMPSTYLHPDSNW